MKVRILAALVWVAVCSLHAATVLFEKSFPTAYTTLDPAGNIYTAGTANGPGITKFDPAGNVVYSRPLPAIVGNWRTMAANAAGEIAIVGSTQYDSLPTSPNVVQPARNAKGTCFTLDRESRRVPCLDAFVVKLDPSGNLAWATYLGGAYNEDATAAALDAAGNVYITGTSESADFPTQQPFLTMGAGALRSAFLTKIDATGTKLVFSTFLNSGESLRPTSIKLDAGGNIYLAGAEQNGVVPATTANPALACPAQSSEAFFSKVSAAGDRMIFAGCLGDTAGYSESNALALDSSGNMYVAGFTNSAFPTTPGAYQSLSQNGATFVSKISPDGATLIFSSRFGSATGPISLAVDRSGAAYVAGPLFAYDFPIVGAARQTCPGPEQLERRFLVKLSANGSQALYSSFDDPTVAGVTLGIGPDDALVQSYYAQPNGTGARLVKISNIEQAGGPLFSPLCVQNGASFKSHWQSYVLQPGVSPGELVTLKGVGLGPSEGAGPALTADGRIDNIDAGVQVLFDGVAAPLLYTQDRQINVVAPYALAGKSQTAIQVVYGGQTSLTATLPVSPVSPAAFLDFSTMLPLVFNADFTRNTPSQPAPRGGGITLFLTGGGQTAPLSFDGEISPDAGALQANVSAVLNNIGLKSIIPLNVLYAGPAPGLTSGVQQINVQIPSDLSPSYWSPFSPVYLIVTIGGQAVSAQVYGQ